MARIDDNHRMRKIIIAITSSLLFTLNAFALQAGSKAPLFSTLTQEGKAFELASRKGVGWTVLYFYPKAETPGCTAQACAFRDAIEAIRKEGAEVYGISGDSVKEIKDFHTNHKLSFTLLADPKAVVIKLYNVKMPLLNMAKRHTFLIDPELVIRNVDTDVDPAFDAQKVATLLKKLKGEKK